MSIFGSMIKGHDANQGYIIANNGVKPKSAATADTVSDIKPNSFSITSKNGVSEKQLNSYLNIMSNFFGDNASLSVIDSKTGSTEVYTPKASENPSVNQGAALPTMPNGFVCTIEIS
jgi:hypothetical protein